MVTTSFHIGLCIQSYMVRRGSPAVNDQALEEVIAQGVARSQQQENTQTVCISSVQLKATASNIKNWVDDVHEEKNTWQSPLAQRAFDDVTGEELELEEVNKARQEEMGWLTKKAKTSTRKSTTQKVTSITFNLLL